MKFAHYNGRMVNVDPKTYNKTKLRYLYRKVLQRIREKPRGYFIFKKMRGFCGLCCWEEGIYIDPRKNLVPTIIHEVLHDLYPNNWEGWTLRLESKIVNIITAYDIFVLLSEFFDKLDITPHTRLAARKKRVKKK